MGYAADYAVNARRGEPLLVAFGAPLASAKPDLLGPRHGCDIRLLATGDPSVYEIALPDRIWTNPSKGCGTRGKVAGAIDVKYGEGTRFAGYTASMGISFILAS